MARGVCVPVRARVRVLEAYSRPSFDSRLSRRRPPAISSAPTSPISLFLSPRPASDPSLSYLSSLIPCEHRTLPCGGRDIHKNVFWVIINGGLMNASLKLNRLQGTSTGEFWSIARSKIPFVGVLGKAAPVKHIHAGRGGRAEPEGTHARSSSSTEAATASPSKSALQPSPPSRFILKPPPQRHHQDSPLRVQTHCPWLRSTSVTHHVGLFQKIRRVSSFGAKALLLSDGPL